MKVIEAEEVQRALDFPSLVAALRTAFGAPAGTPRRTVYQLAEGDPFHDAFAVLPAWTEEVIGVKAFTYLPSNVPKTTSAPTSTKSPKCFTTARPAPASNSSQA